MRPWQQEFAMGLALTVLVLTVAMAFFLLGQAIGRAPAGPWLGSDPPPAAE